MFVGKKQECFRGAFHPKLLSYFGFELPFSRVPNVVNVVQMCGDGLNHTGDTLILKKNKLGMRKLSPKLQITHSFTDSLTRPLTAVTAM